MNNKTVQIIAQLSLNTILKSYNILCHILQIKSLHLISVCKKIFITFLALKISYPQNFTQKK